MDTVSDTNMHRTPSTLLPDHWLDSQRLMVGLTLALVKERGSAAAIGLMDEALMYLRPPAGAPDPDLEAEYLARLEVIHPATLKRLADLSPDHLPAKWASHLPYWTRAHLRLQNDGEYFPLVGAQLIADRIVNGHHTPAQIQQLGVAELSPDWHNFLPGKEFEWVLKSARARASNRDPHEVLEALAEFRSANSPMRWELVENALLQRLFIWPLLILETDDVSLEFSLPVLLQIATTGSQLPAVVNSGPLNAAQWEVSVRRATYAAKCLWQTKHKSAPPWLKDSVEHLSASLDLGYAARIVEPFAIKLQLIGESAESYFGLAVLSSLIDPTSIENVCATGGIGYAKPDPEGGGDHTLKEPNYVKRKFLYARDSYFFDTFLSPKPWTDVASEKHLYVPKEDTKRHHDGKRTYFSHFCDHVFGQKWRKHQYVRVPDLAEAYRPSDRQLRRDLRRLSDPEVTAVLNRLKGNHAAAMHIDDIPPEKVATALFAVNHNVQVDRLATYAFVRAVPDAINERMWWPIWDLISGSEETFDRFRFTVSSKRAAAIFAEEMNKLYPTEADPRRAPDLLIVAYTRPDLHFDADPTVPGSPFERLRIQPMMNAINSLTGASAMIRSPVPTLHERIGNTRIIFVHDCTSAAALVRDGTSESSDCEELANALARLSVFRFGFKREHARHVLGFTEDECDRILSLLSTSTTDRASPLVFAEGAGEYFIASSGSVTLNPKQLAECHFEAANAITGILAPREGVFRANLRDAFSPRWVQEAQWHLEQAQELVQHLDPNRLGEIRQAQRRLSRLAEPFGWTHVRWTIRQIRDRRVKGRKPLSEADFASSAIRKHFASAEEKDDDGKSRFWRETHPTEYILAARYFNELAAQDGNAPAKKSEFLEVRDDYLSKAWVRATKDHDMLESEKRSCQFLHASASYCMFLVESPDELGLAKGKHLIKRIEEYLDCMPALDRNDQYLFEYLGDQTEDPYLALGWYRLGVCNPQISWMRPWPSLAFKYVGAAKMAGVSPSDEATAMLTLLWKHSDAKKRTIPVGGIDKLLHVQERWSIGRAATQQGEYYFGSYIA